jgi:hypothetical protein
MDTTQIAAGNANWHSTTKGNFIKDVAKAFIMSTISFLAILLLQIFPKKKNHIQKDWDIRAFGRPWYPMVQNKTRKI